MLLPPDLSIFLPHPPWTLRLEWSWVSPEAWCSQAMAGR